MLYNPDADFKFYLFIESIVRKQLISSQGKSILKNFKKPESDFVRNKLFVDPKLCKKRSNSLSISKNNEIMHETKRKIYIDLDYYIDGPEGMGKFNFNLTERLCENDHHHFKEFRRQNALDKYNFNYCHSRVVNLIESKMERVHDS